MLDGINLILFSYFIPAEAQRNGGIYKSFFLDFSTAVEMTFLGESI